MKYVNVPVEGGDIQIDVRSHTVSLVLAIEDGSRTVRVDLYGVSADAVVRRIVAVASSFTVDAVQELSGWG